VDHQEERDVEGVGRPLGGRPRLDFGREGGVGGVCRRVVRAAGDGKAENRLHAEDRVERLRLEASHCEARGVGENVHDDVEHAKEVAARKHVGDLDRRCEEAGKDAQHVQGEEACELEFHHQLEERLVLRARRRSGLGDACVGTQGSSLVVTAQKAGFVHASTCALGILSNQACMPVSNCSEETGNTMDGSAGIHEMALHTIIAYWTASMSTTVGLGAAAVFGVWSERSLIEA
jgi:hypothetical protein